MRSGVQDVLPGS